MKFAVALSAAALAFANTVSADSEEFGFLTLRSASRFHFNPITAKNGILYFGGADSSAKGIITDDGALKYNDKYVAINEKGYLTLVDTEDKAAHGFAVQNGYLVHDSHGFCATPDGDDFAVGTECNVEGVTGVGVRPVGPNGDPVPDFPKNAPVSKQVKGEIVSQIGDGQIQANKPEVQTQTANGVAKQGLSFGAGVVAAAALLL